MYNFSASEMDQWGKALATKPEDMNSTPTTHMVEGKNWLLQADP